MSYQVIARKYRPQRFQDVVGQEHVSRTLANAIGQKRIAHAYIFCGPRGTGKTTMARIFAKCLNCTDGPKVNFDDNDPRCAEITEGRSMDVLEIDGASNRGIDEIRELRDTVIYAPASSKFKIYIIDEVHMLTKEAFNALLKTLEEPPAHVKFMFATTEPEKVLPTVLSRCQRHDLRRIPVNLIASHLKHICGLEKVTIDEGALFAVSRGAEGCMRDAESALDQLISFCGEKIAEGDVLSMFGLTAQGQLFSVAEAILAGDASKALQSLHELALQGKDLGRLLGDLLAHFRNRLVYQVSGGNMDLLEVSEAEAVLLEKGAKAANPHAIGRILEILTDCESRLGGATSKKILIEVSLFKAAQAGVSVGLDDVLQTLNQLRGQDVAIAPVSPARTVAPDAARPAATSKSMPVAPQAGDEMNAVTPASAGSLEELWHQLAEASGKASPFIKTYLVHAHPISFEKGLFVVGFDPSHSDHIALVDNPRNHKLLAEELRELGHPDASFRFLESPAPEGWKNQVAVAAETQQVAPDPLRGKSPKTAAKDKSHGKATSEAKAPSGPQPQPFDPEEFKNDPLIQKALELFKGRIIEVRK